MESGSPRTYLEHEAKLIAAPSFRMPPLNRVAPGLITAEPRHQILTATYFDTNDLALARSGITLRHRSGDRDKPWTLKFPIDQTTSALVRSEIAFDEAPTHVPVAAADLVRAYTRSRSLERIARLSTRRSIIELRNAKGELVAEVVDDKVAVFEGEACTINFREIEVELHTSGPHANKVLQSVVKRLIAAGAVAESPLPKLVRALGDRAVAPPDVDCETMKARDWKRADLRRLIRHCLCTSVAEMIRHDAGVRLDDDAEHLHAYRVATRQLRSNLRTFAPLLDPAWTTALRAELAWIGTSLGAVRECDVLATHLQSQQPSLSKDRLLALDFVLEHLAAERTEARRSLLADMRSPRYDQLITQVSNGARHPAFDPSSNKRLHTSATQMGPHLARRTWRALARAMDDAEVNPSVETLHNIRIRAKRCRYAAEALDPVVGQPARRFARRMSLLQDVLGELHDADAAEQWLRSIAAALPTTKDCVEDLIALERIRSDKAQHEWPPIVRRAHKDKKLVAWLRPR